MTRTMYDAADGAATFPEPVPIVAGYVDGRYVSAPGLFARYPLARHVPITVTAHDPAAFAKNVNGVLCLDIESGDASPGEAGGWTLEAITAGVLYPWIYFSTSNHDAVIASLRATGVPGLVQRVSLWGAQWDGVPVVPPGYVAKQYQSLDTFDRSAVLDYVPGLDSAPPTQHQESSTMYLCAIAQPDGRGYRIYPWSPKYVAVPCSTAGGLESEYAQLAAGGIAHLDNVAVLVMLQQVREALVAQGRPTDPASIEAAIAPAA